MAADSWSDLGKFNLGVKLNRLFGRLRSAVFGTDPAIKPEHHTVRGFRVAVENSRADLSTAAVLERLDEALALIETYQPWRLRHMRRDLSGFWIVRYPCRGAFLPQTRTCLTELTFLARRDITAAPVASSILHEGMHARIHAMGAQPATPDAAREERICRRAELAFGRALPDQLGAPVVARAEASLELDDGDVAPEIDWQEARRRQQAIDASPNAAE